MAQASKTSGSIVVNGQRIELMARQRADGRVAVLVRDAADIFPATSDRLCDGLRQAWRDALRDARRNRTVS